LTNKGLHFSQKYFVLTKLLSIPRRLLLSFLLLITATQSNPIEIECEYTFSSVTQFYQCGFGHINITDDLTQSFVFTGNHLPNRSDADVTSVWIDNATIPFMLTDIFRAFPNIRHMITSYAGLKRFQPSAVVSARNLIFFTVVRNPTLNEIQSHAFGGASHLDSLDLSSNNISMIHRNAFVGLNRLVSLGLHNNALETLPSNVLWPLRRMTVITLSSNRLTVLDGRLFISKSRLFNINLSNNPINAIERTFMQYTRVTRFMNFQRNICVNDFFDFQFQSNETIWGAFETCFDNFDRLESSTTEDSTLISP
jgi:Leucine-rich repeat (LRR) protein